MTIRENFPIENLGKAKNFILEKTCYTVLNPLPLFWVIICQAFSLPKCSTILVKYNNRAAWQLFLATVITLGSHVEWKQPVGIQSPAVVWSP